ncbi:WSC domain-containing protein [Lentinula detonsa]|uniref:WSC domain-containing protein n=1 Tax=Lentinula detonsa TaxID=2804962 RepID=A0A9W8P8B7_9AGAR|nr:WSC domain-containing protein [Lentinula detonsa]
MLPLGYSFVILLAHPWSASFVEGSTKVARQTSIPSGWSFYSCFIDNTLSGRLLTVNSGLPSSTVTAVGCVEYCSSNNWTYAGVEYGGECYCDEVLHETGSQETSSSDCDMPCNGDTSQTCGGPNRIDVYWDGDLNVPSSPPTLYQSYWTYSGCFVDNTSQRTLIMQVEPPSSSVSPPTCADTCTFYGYTTMGTEFGDECWCGNDTGSAAQVADTECAMTCNANRDYFCGDANRLSVYHNNPPQETYSSECLDLNVPSWLNISNFTLFASPKEPPTSSGGWEGSTLHIIDILVDGDATYSLISACQDCNVTWLGLSFSGTGAGYLIPSVSSPEGAPPMLSLNLIAGISVVFQTRATIPNDLPDYPNFCTVANPYPSGSGYSPTDGPVLQGDYHADAWAMCPNISAVPANRLDLVSQPQPDHPNYNVEECIPVDVWVE